MEDDEVRMREFGQVIARLIRGESIGRAQARECWRQICHEEQPDLQQGAFIAALSAKGETPEEIAGTFEALYEHDTTKVTVKTSAPLIDNCGTGADTLKTFNISTAAAIVAAACGVNVVRHAARAITSNCGAIDVIEALGVNVEAGPEIPKQSIENAGIGAWNAFLPSIHPRTLGRVLSQIRFGSTINIVGPLLNPTMPDFKVMGVPKLEMIDIEAQTLRELGVRRAFVMHGLDDASDKGMDELSTLGQSNFAELQPDGTIRHGMVRPEQFGMKVSRHEEICSSRDVERDALMLLRVIMGAGEAAHRDIVCLNAAPLLYVMDQVKTLEDGVRLASRTLANGGALGKLREWVRWQNAVPDDGLPLLEKMIARAASA